MPQPEKFRQPKLADLRSSIEACLANGQRLLNDALQLEFQEPASTRLMISMLAQSLAEKEVSDFSPL